jgi:hypothetical protein
VVKQNLEGRDIAMTSITISEVLTIIDVWVGNYESFANSNVGGTFENTSGYLRISDGAGNKHERNILSFATSSIPDTATITSAVLKFKQHYTR